MKMSGMMGVLLLSGWSLAMAAPALAATRGAPMQARKVFYADLDVASPDGAASVRRRVTAASRVLCGPQPDLKNLEASKRFNACVTGSVNRAMAQIQARHVASIAGTNER